MADTVSVTQADRDAAANWCEAQPFPSKQAEAALIRVGDYDHHSLVQAFARHRLASTQPAPAFPREEVAAEVRALRDALLWYRDNAAMCRKIGSIGEPARKALDADGGKRADEVMDNSPVLAALLQGKQP